MPLTCSCCISPAPQVVGHTYKMAHLSFPAVLDRLGVQAFDLHKLIAAFVRSEPSLPVETKRHLLHLEERICEAKAWAPGSSLYAALAAAVGAPGERFGRERFGC